MLRRIAYSTMGLRGSTAATRLVDGFPPTRRPVPVSRVSSRPGIDTQSWDVSSKRRSLFGRMPGGPWSTRPLLGLVIRRMHPGLAATRRTSRVGYLSFGGAYNHGYTPNEGRHSGPAELSPDQAADLVGLGHPHGEDGPRVDEQARGGRPADADDLGGQGDPEETLEEPPHHPRDRPEEHRGRRDPHGDHRRLGAFQTTVEADTQAMELEGGHDRVGDDGADDQTRDAEWLVQTHADHDVHDDVHGGQARRDPRTLHREEGSREQEVQAPEGQAEGEPEQGEGHQFGGSAVEVPALEEQAHD